MKHSDIVSTGGNDVLRTINLFKLAKLNVTGWERRVGETRSTTMRMSSLLSSLLVDVLLKSGGGTGASRLFLTLERRCRCAARSPGSSPSEARLVGAGEYNIGTDDDKTVDGRVAVAVLILCKLF
jgi:hypothetical protein